MNNPSAGPSHGVMRFSDDTMVYDMIAAAEDDRALPAPRPFLKWVGGKRQLLPELRKALPQGFQHYYEPFLGGGALFFDLRASGWVGPATLGDGNTLLVRTYLGVRNDVDGVIEGLSGMRYDKKEYLETRARDVGRREHDEVAAWFIYLNRCGFNGLYRVNKAGKFNVPFGKYTNPTICDAPTLRAASNALHGVNFKIGDFEKTVRTAERGDLVYFDPPYVGVSATANFVTYTWDGFSFEDQIRLRDCALRLKKLGVHVILSNSDTLLVRELYGMKEFTMRRVEARRSINSKGGERGPVGEVIIT